MTDFDVIIVGGGIVGSATAHFLAGDASLRGRVAVLEQDPTYAHAATALSASSIRQQFSSPVNVRMSRFGLEFLQAAATALAVDDAAVDVGLVVRSYLYLATQRGREALEGNVRIQRELGVDAHLADAAELTRAYPWLTVDDLAGGAYTRGCEGWFDAYALLQALRRRARMAGIVHRHARVVAFGMRGDTITNVRLDDGRELTARWFVCAAGTWTPALLRPLGIDLPVGARKRTVFVFESPASILEAPLVIDPSGLWFRPEGRGWLCGLPPSPDPVVDVDDFAADATSFEEHAWPLLAARVPGFEAARCTRSWVGHYDYNEFDQNAFVGPVPAARNLLIASGFSGHGLQQAPAVGRGLAELITRGRYAALDLSELGYARYLDGRPLVEANVI